MFTIDTDIARPPDVVFARLAAVEETPRWYSAVESAEPLTPAPLGVGSRFRMVRELPGGRAENEVEVTEFVPDQALTLQSRSGPTPFTYRYTLSPLAGGGTRLHLDGEISGAGLGGVAGLLAPLAPSLFARGMRTNLAAFKALVEAA